MATEWVVDASIATKRFIQEADSTPTFELLRGLLGTGRLISPGLLRYEVGNAGARHGVPNDFEARLAAALVGIEPVEPSEVAPFVGPLSYYDAAYVALAVERKAGLVSADDQMRKAAKKHGIEVLP